jgi:hypothetical protein
MLTTIRILELKQILNGKQQQTTIGGDYTRLSKKNIKSA